MNIGSNLSIRSSSVTSKISSSLSCVNYVSVGSSMSIRAQSSRLVIGGSIPLSGAASSITNFLVLGSTTNTVTPSMDTASRESKNIML